MRTVGGDADDLEAIAIHANANGVDGATDTVVARHKHTANQIDQSRNDLEVPRIPTADRIEIDKDVTSAASEVELGEWTSGDVSATLC